MSYSTFTVCELRKCFLFPGSSYFTSLSSCVTLYDTALVDAPGCTSFRVATRSAGGCDARGPFQRRIGEAVVMGSADALLVRSG